MVYLSYIYVHGYVNTRNWHSLIVGRQNNYAKNEKAKSKTELSIRNQKKKLSHRPIKLYYYYYHHYFYYYYYYYYFVLSFDQL